MVFMGRLPCWVQVRAVAASSSILLDFPQDQRAHRMNGFVTLNRWQRALAAGPEFICSNPLPQSSRL